MSTPEILMYARERFCPDVARARRVLSEYEIPWTEFNIEADASAAAETVRLTGRRNVPTLVIGSRILVEPSASQIEDALKTAGFDLSDSDE